MKSSSLQNKFSKLMPKSFIRSTHGVNVGKLCFFVTCARLGLFVTKKLQAQIVSTETVRKEPWYEKTACKVLLKLTAMPKFFA